MAKKTTSSMKLPREGRNPLPDMSPICAVRRVGRIGDREAMKKLDLDHLSLRERSDAVAAG